jgi:hypothetical protein
MVEMAFDVELADAVASGVDVILLLLFTVERLLLLFDRGLTSPSALTSRIMTSSLDRERPSS